MFSHETQYMLGDYWWNAFKASTSINVLLSMLLGAWGQVSVATFIVISSYYCCDKQGIKLSRIVEIVLQTQFLRLVIGIIGMMANNQVSLKIFAGIVIKAILSPISGEYWFVTGFIVLSLLTPCLQVFLQHISKKSLISICIILVTFVTIGDFFYLRFCGSLLDFITIFLVTAYIKLYKNEWITTKSNIIGYGAMAIILIMSFMINYVATITGIDAFYKIIPHIFVNWNILIFASAIGLFYSFQQYKIKSNCIINAVAKCSLGIYVLSENSVVSGENAWLWVKIFGLNSYFNEPNFILYLVIAGIIVFITTMVIEMIRIAIFNVFKEKMEFINAMALSLDRFCKLEER